MMKARVGAWVARRAAARPTRYIHTVLLHEIGQNAAHTPRPLLEVTLHNGHVDRGRVPIV